MTARWVVDVVAPERNLQITWQPISLLRKNKPDPDGEAYPVYLQTHKMLRVMESVRKAEGDDAFFRLYWEVGTRIHHDGDRDFDLADALASIGLDTANASAADDEFWDEEIASRMDAGLALVGEDVGTPLIAIDRVAGQNTGERVGIFGPVITRVPDTKDSLELWDAMVTMTRIPGFWELKRTRTERAEFGERPALASEAGS